MHSRYPILKAGGKLLYHSILSNVYRDGDLWVAEFLSKGSRVRIRCRYLIDATGDADTISAIEDRKTASDGGAGPQ